MKYLSIAQTAERWGISTRRIQILCGEGASPVLSVLARSGDSRGRREASGRKNQNGKYIKKPTENEK